MSDNTVNKPTEEEDERKMVGGKVPVALYWEFKTAYAKRKESATAALENALRLYIDLPINEINQGEE